VRTKFPIKSSGQSGFSFIELTFVLIIVAVVISTIVFTTQARLDASRIFVTKERMQTIMDAIDRYVENRFSYIVNEDFTLKSNYETALYTETRIEIANFDDNDTLNADAAFVLISHGPNAHGAYVGKSPASGTTVRQITISSPSSNDTENSWVSGAGGDAAVFVQAMPQSGYDDILLYKPKWRLPEPIN